MRGSGLLLLAGAFAALAACSDVTGPRASSASGNGGSAFPAQLVELRGVVEMVDESTFGLRWGNQQVILLSSATDVLMDALGKEVIVRGQFTPSGEFAVASVQLDDEGGYDLFRAAPRNRRPSA